MDIMPLLMQEYEREAATLRHFFDRIPDDKMQWQPHEKSYSLQKLLEHLADIASWPEFVLLRNDLNFEDGYKPESADSREGFQKILERSIEKGKAAIAQTNEPTLNETWTMRSGNTIYAKWSKYEAMRHTLGQLIHHRAQLGVYYRLLNIPVPGAYGPSADEMGM